MYIPFKNTFIKHIVDDSILVKIFGRHDNFSDSGLDI